MNLTYPIVADQVWKEMIKDHTGEWGMDIHNWDWVPGVGVIAMLEYYEATRKPEVIAYLQTWVQQNVEKSKGTKVINSIAPYAIFPALYRVTEDSWFREEAVRVAEWLIKETPRTREDAFEHTVTENAEFKEQVWADTIYMAVLFLARTASLNGSTIYAEEALKQVLIHLRLLQDEETNVLFHGWNCGSGDHMSAARWTRANAWIAAGIPMIVEEIAHLVAIPDELKERYGRLMSGLLSYQQADGLWSTVMDQPHFYREVSGSAGIAYGLLKGMEMGLIPLQEETAASAERVFHAILPFITEQGTVEGVSGGTPVMPTIQAYQDDIPTYPTLYGQGLVLMLLAKVMTRRRLNMQRNELWKAIQINEEQYDASVQLVRTPLTATYHTALKPQTHPFVYALYPSVCYAYDLLCYGGEAYTHRAAEILRVVIAQQDQDETRASYGIWPYFFEESLDEMDRPDWNMADFHGKRLVLILKKYAASLPQPLVEEIRESVYHACQAIVRRNVGPHYTNIAIMGAFVTLVGGELLGDYEIRNYGEKRLKRFYDFTTGIGTFSEYNSPCYSPIAIEELDSIYQESSTLEAVTLAEQLLDMAWQMIAKHVHPATGEWSGPYSRTYYTLITEREKHFLGNALNKESMGIQCPEKYHAYFSSKEERYFTEPTLMAAETGYQNFATTYQNERVSLGSYTCGSMWNQRRNLLGFVDVDGRKAFVQLQFLKDGKDFCSAIFTGVQSREKVLFGFNLATDNGAWHQDLDLINGRFRASDLRIRLLIGGDLKGLELPTVVEGKRLTAMLGATQLHIEAVLEESDYGELKVVAERSEDALNLDYVIYDGEEKAFDFHAIHKAVWLFALSLGQPGQLAVVDVTQEANSVTATIGEKDEQMSIMVPIAPGKTSDLYRNNRVQLPGNLLELVK